MLVLRFIAAIEEPARVFCRGEVRLPDKGHYPAVLTYNPIYKQTLAWAPSGRKDKMTGHHEAFFWSNMPHVGIAREVLLEPETSAYNGGAPSPRAEGIAEPQSAKAKDGDWR